MSPLVPMLAPGTHHDFVIALPVKSRSNHPVRQPSRKITVDLLVAVHTRIPLALTIALAGHVLLMEPITVVETNHVGLGRWVCGKDLQIIQADRLFFEGRQNVTQTVLDGIRDKLQLEVAHLDVDEPYGVSGLYDPDEIVVADVIELSDGELYVDLRVQYEADVYAYVYKSDAYILADGHEFPLEVSDWDWNESYVEVSGTIGLDVSIEITFKPESKEEPMLEVREASTRKNHPRDHDGY